MRYNFIRQTSNKKTGLIPVIYSDRSTCPGSCPHKETSCYAETGHVKQQWEKTNKPLNVTQGSETGIALFRLIELIVSLPFYSLMRYGVAGDLPGNGEDIDKESIKQIAKACQKRHLKAWLYTHKKCDLSFLKKISNSNLVINVSCDTYDEVDRLSEHSLPLVLTVQSDAPKVSYTPMGRRVILCPATQKDSIQCVNCGGQSGPLCARTERDYVVGFPAHGARKRKVDERLKSEILAM